MIPHSKKFRKGPSKILPLFFALFLLLLIGFLAISNWELNQKRVKFNSQLEILSKKIQNLENINRNLKEKISAIPEENYLEKVAREIFNLKKPGEQVVVIKKEETKPPPVKTEEQRESFNLRNWFDYIKSKILPY